MNSGAMLNAYPDSMGGKLSDIATIMERPEFRDVFRSIYILPSVFNTDLDRGFSVISYDLNRQLASSKDLERLQAMNIDLKLDFVLNHLSVLSPQFQDILQKGDASEYRDFFIDWNKFWQGHGIMTEGGYIQPDQEMIRHMFFRKPGLPFLMVRLPDGRDVPYWNTFYQEVCYGAVTAQDLMRVFPLQYCEANLLSMRIAAAFADGKHPEEIDFSDFPDITMELRAMLNSRRSYLGQIDLNLNSELVWSYYDEVLGKLAEYGASIVRLDAFAYAPKTPGKRNFFNEPDTWDALARLREFADRHHVMLLPEIHASYGEGIYEQIAEKGYTTYDFFLPGLIIDAIEYRDGTTLATWANEQKNKGIRTINMLGCHDGIPMLDLKGLIPEERIEALIELIVSRGGLIKNLHGQKNVYYQVNATYYSALGEDDRKMLLARALQLFMPGKPQVWYLDLFAGTNDIDAVKRNGAAGHKEINRTNLTQEQITQALTRPVVRDQLELLRIHNTCAAFDFDAEMTVTCPSKEQLVFVWKKDAAQATLRVNLSTFAFSIEANTTNGFVCFRKS